MQFKVRRILEKKIENEIQKIGFSPSYLDFGVLKHKFLNIKIFNLKPEAATIIKETALASNCDAAIHRGVLDHSIEASDLILSGSAALYARTGIVQRAADVRKVRRILQKRCCRDGKQRTMQRSADGRKAGGRLCKRGCGGEWARLIR